MSFYQDQKKWKQKLIPIEVSRKNSDGVIDLIFYKNHYALIKKLNVFLDHHKNFICRRCLNSYTSENMLSLHKSKCENYDITTIRTSSESHLLWKKNIFIRIHCILGYTQILKLMMKSIILVLIMKQLIFSSKIPILNGYNTKSELDDILESGY